MSDRLINYFKISPLDPEQGIIKGCFNFQGRIELYEVHTIVPNTTLINVKSFQTRLQIWVQNRTAVMVLFGNLKQVAHI